MAEGKLAPKPTEQQKKVLDGLKAGKSAGELAKQLNITRNGVYAHQRRLRAKGLLPKAAKKKRASGSKPRRSSNARHNLGPVVRAMRKANAIADKRVAQIKSERSKLDDELAAIEAARKG